MPEGSPTLPVVAAKLGMSPRTLQRRLDEAGTSWRTEVDSVRAEQVRLLGSELSQRAVATRLGYRDERSLRRARQRWANSGNRP
ncbi:helix-turn-helix domain-containing protein [Nocardia sp. NPDC050413]|uniref:helix-turn-helix domain-containing protein n=1 Tax=Nocardia sp. NPDC050413 TaxID=3155784 RepID=UPI0033D2B0AD